MELLTSSAGKAITARTVLSSFEVVIRAPTEGYWAPMELPPAQWGCSPVLQAFE